MKRDRIKKTVARRASPEQVRRLRQCRHGNAETLGWRMICLDCGWICDWRNYFWRPAKQKSLEKVRAS